VESDKFEKYSVRCFNVWYIRDVTNQGYLVSKECVGHKAQKPLEVIERIIKGSSNRENLVLDSFLGSGTATVACEKLNRRRIGIEINPEYCEIAKKRIEAMICQEELFEV
jgi:DNA modification methylase